LLPTTSRARVSPPLIKEQSRERTGKKRCPFALGAGWIREKPRLDFQEPLLLPPGPLVPARVAAGHRILAVRAPLGATRKASRSAGFCSLTRVPCPLALAPPRSRRRVSTAMPQDPPQDRLQAATTGGSDSLLPGCPCFDSVGPLCRAAGLAVDYSSAPASPRVVHLNFALIRTAWYSLYGVCSLLVLI
jgi:hypothetical protein